MPRPPTKRLSRNDPARTSKLPVAVCGGCSTRWQSNTIAHCGSCHATFGSTDLFDRHRRNDRCIYPLLMGKTIRLVNNVWREPKREGSW